MLYNCILSQPLLASKQTSSAISWHSALSSHWFPCVVIAPVQGWINPCWTRMVLYHSSKDQVMLCTTALMSALKETLLVHQRIVFAFFHYQIIAVAIKWAMIYRYTCNSLLSCYFIQQVLRVYWIFSLLISYSHFVLWNFDFYLLSVTPRLKVIRYLLYNISFYLFVSSTAISSPFFRSYGRIQHLPQISVFAHFRVLPLLCLFSFVLFLSSVLRISCVAPQLTPHFLCQDNQTARLDLIKQLSSLAKLSRLYSIFHLPFCVIISTLMEWFCKSC